MDDGSLTPRIAIGLAVRNGSDTIERCVRSILDQDWTDLELIVSDNASDDGTSAILERLAAADPRVKLERLATNIGQHGNMNRVFDRATAPLYRWISADDWLEPNALSAYVDALDARPDAVGATAYFVVHPDRGGTVYEEYRGEFPDSPDPVRRLSRMLWFFHAGDTKYDPVYGVYRRAVLLETPRIRKSEQADWLLSAQLALLGPIVNVDSCLSHRTRTYATETQRRRYRARLHPEDPEGARSSVLRLRRDLLKIVAGAPLTGEQRKACSRMIVRFTLMDALRRTRQQARWAGGRVLRRTSAGRRFLDSRGS
jgi:glycosyltransferase involved in cell wall biosynthesis